MNQIYIKIDGSREIYPWPGEKENPPLYIDEEDFRLRGPKATPVFEYVFSPDTLQYIIKDHPHDDRTS